MAKTGLIARLPTQPGRRDEVIATFDAMLTQVAGEHGTEHYIVSKDSGDENLLWVWELYSDDEAMAAHSSSDAMKALLKTMGVLLDDGVGLHVVKPVRAKGAVL